MSTFSLEASDSTLAAAATQVVEVESSEDLAKPGPLKYLVEVDPLEDLTTSTDYRPEDENDIVRLCAIIDTCRQYPTYPHMFCDTHVTPDLVCDLLELGPCQPGLNDNFDSFTKDEDGRHFSPTWYMKKMKNACEISKIRLLNDRTVLDGLVRAERKGIGKKQENTNKDYICSPLSNQTVIGIPWSSRVSRFRLPKYK